MLNVLKVRRRPFPLSRCNGDPALIRIAWPASPDLELIQAEKSSHIMARSQAIDLASALEVHPLDTLHHEEHQHQAIDLESGPTGLLQV